jgi:glycosyltransferase involved in cell wall biosynthesis
MAKVCAVVFNTISRDARVLKEADSLQRAGHQVTLIGLTDRTQQVKTEMLANGVNIRRLDVDAIKKSAFAFTDGLMKLFLFALIVALSFLPQEQLIGLILIILLISIGAMILKRLRRARGLIKMALIFEEQPVWDKKKNGFRRYLPFAEDFFEATRNKVSFIGRIICLYLIVKRLQPEVLHCHDVHTLPIGILAKWTMRCLVVYDAHEIYEEVAQGNAERAKFYKRIHQWGQGRADGFITINDSIAAWYAEHYPKLPPSVVVKNATLVAGPIAYDGRLHQAAHIPLERKILLYQGGFSTKRGLEYLVESARYFEPEWALVMMGWGGLEPRLREIAHEVNKYHVSQGNPEAVIFIPPAPQKDLALWTAGGTVGIIPYEKVGLNHWFCTPNKLWEYPNAGLPVLVSPFPELSRPVLEYGYGWLLPEEQEPKKLAEFINALSAEQINTAKENCANFMRVDNWETYGERLVALYATLYQVG